MALPQGIDFRNTAGFVTDPTNCDYVNATHNQNYPSTTAQGNTVGFESASVSGYQDNSALTGDQAKLSGLVFWTGVANTFRFDLPSTGNYNVQVANGNATGGPNTAGVMTLKDTTTVLATLVTNHSVSAGNWYDATDTLRTSAANWVANEAAVGNYAFTTTILRFTLNPVSGFAVLSHLWVEAASGAAPDQIWAEDASNQIEDEEELVVFDLAPLSGDDLPQQGIYEDGQYTDPEDEPFEFVGTPLSTDFIPDQIWAEDGANQIEDEEELLYFDTAPLPLDVLDPPYNNHVIDPYDYDDQDEPFDFQISPLPLDVPDQIWAEDASNQLEDEDDALLQGFLELPLSANAPINLARERTKMGVGT